MNSSLTDSPQILAKGEAGDDSFFLSSRRGFTLLELLVVLTILVALAGIVLFSLSRGFTVRSGDQEWTAEETVTWSNMETIREAILGSGLESPGFREDVGAMPDTIAELLRQPDGVPSFDPAYARGWRGPYLQPTGARYRLNSLDGFTEDYGEEGDPAILDAWGRPFVIQNPDTSYARLVSAGQNGELEFPADIDETTNFTTLDSGDDLVLFLLINDPRP